MSNIAEKVVKHAIMTLYKQSGLISLVYDVTISAFLHWIMTRFSDLLSKWCIITVKFIIRLVIMTVLHFTIREIIVVNNVFQTWWVQLNIIFSADDVSKKVNFLNYTWDQAAIHIFAWVLTHIVINMVLSSGIL